MVRNLILSGAMIAAVLGSTAVQAQTDGAPDMKSGNYNDHLLHDYAFCLARGDKKAARKAIEAEPGTPAAENGMQELMQGQPFCARAKTLTRIPGYTVRGAIAEQVYLMTYPKPPVAVTPSEAPKPAAATPYTVADCASKHDQIGADTILRAPRGSPAEKAALDAFMPALNACAGGAKVGFDSVTIHGLIAESLYKVRRAEVAKERD